MDFKTWIKQSELESSCTEDKKEDKDKDKEKRKRIDKSTKAVVRVSQVYD